MNKTEAYTCEIILNRALDETWRSEYREGQYVVYRTYGESPVFTTPQEVGDHIETIWEEKAQRRADNAHADACDLGIGCY